MSAPAVAVGPKRRVAPPPPGPSRKISSDGVSTNNPTSYDALKLKYMTVDRNYETLKELTRKGMFRVQSFATNLSEREREREVRVLWVRVKKLVTDMARV